MPIFEYQCQTCGQIFEKIRSTSSEHEKCPKCDGVAVRKVSITAASSSSAPSSSAACGSGRFG
ncbi:zinc ribbon domain-containing protein [Desulfuromonas sp. AOP6]|uniref:FmdB family zinc ribbon protein n=1 Tax=Desulfuromonas sp. AOP6 TaxID=1566351 RepID=UPI001278CD4C|nr:zinc ribbon domain-containing protein [Desulfuromonas sp. AOP6]BCA80038.1 hypothetical protein AOP6_1825 [Desulfuromonas sp. AOP6]